MRHVRIVLAGLGILLVFGCSSKQSDNSVVPEEDYDYTTTLVDGVRMVSNPEDPWKGSVVYTVVDEVSIGIDVGEEPYMLNRPMDVKVDEEGRIYVLDWGDTQIQVYDASGVYERTIGRRGQGPGEFDTPCYFDISRDGRIFVMDGRNQRVTVFDLKGEHQQDFRVQGFYSSMICDPLDRLYSQNQTPMKETAVSDELQEIPMLTSLHRIDPATGGSFHYGNFEGEKIMSRRMESGGSMMVGITFKICWGVSPTGKVFLGHNETFDLGVYSDAGELEFRFGRAFTPVPRPDVKADWAPKVHPAYDSRRLVFDEGGNLWLKLFTEEGFDGFLYDVFTSEGIYLKQAVVPYSIYVFKHGRAYGLVYPEDGFYSAKSFRLISTRPEGGG